MDTSAEPVIVTTYHELDSAADFAALERAFQEVYARGGRKVFIADLGKVKIPSADGRKRASEMEKNLSAMTVRVAIASVNVVRSSLVRGAMTAIRWFGHPATEEHYVASMRDAVAKAKQLLARERVLLPESSAKRLDEIIAASDR